MENCSFVDIKALLRFKRFLSIEDYKSFRKLNLQDLFLDYLKRILSLVNE